MKTKLVKATDSIDGKSNICAETTVFPLSGTNKNVIVLSLDDRTGGGGLVLSPEDARIFAEGTLNQVSDYDIYKTIEIPTDSDVSMSVQLARVTCNGNELPDEVCVSLIDGEDDDHEVVSILTFAQTRTLIAQLKNLIGE